MKLLLSVTITIKDYFPKNKSIHYENYICLFSLNNFNAKINLSNLKNHNFIKHKVETSNSNIVYNLHMLDSIKKSLIGIYQLIINFDKIKNLNINDILTQEETAKIIIDSKTKRKIFNKIANIDDIFLIISTEIRILDKKIHKSGNKQTKNMKKATYGESSENISELNLTPKTFKKKQIIRTMKNDHEALKRMDTFTGYNEISMVEGFKDENDTTFCPASTIKKYKSLNTAKMKAKNNSKYNEFYNANNKNFNNSSTVILSPNHSNTYYNYKKDSKAKTNRKKNPSQRKKVTILNLMEQKIEPSIYRQKEDSFLELRNTQSKDFTNSSVNFNKIKLRSKSKKNSCDSMNNYHCNFKENIKQNYIRKNYNLNENNFYQRKSYQHKNKIFVNVLDKNQIEQTVSERKINSKNALNLMDIGRLNTEMIKNDVRQNKIGDNIFLQTETSIKKKSERKKNCRNRILSDIDIKKFMKKKNNFIKENFHNNYLTEKTRGTFSPKLSLKIRFTEGIVYSTDKNDKFSNRYKERVDKKILTPKGNQIKKVAFSNEDNLLIENEELKKKCFNLIDFYSLLTKKLRKTCLNNIKNIKKIEIFKENMNNLNKYKYKIAQMKNLNESNKIANHVKSHFEEENLLNKMMKIKLKENSIYQKVFGNYDSEHNIHNKINIFLSQKKEMLLNLIRNIVKYYGNISQIYNKDKNKKYLFKNLLNKYGIKEKIKTDLNYINYMNKGNNFDDKVITEVDEDKENEEDEEEKKDNNDNKFSRNTNIKNIKQINIQNINNIFNDNIEQEDEKIINNKENKIEEIQIFTFKTNTNIDNTNYIIKNNKKDLEENYDNNLNNLIHKILIEQFSENYKTNMKFVHQDKNKYSFNNKIFYAYIENNDVVLKEEINGINDNNKYTLSEFYQKYCTQEKNMDKSNFVYTKKLRQKYIKIKYNEEQSLEKKLKNENSTTIDTEMKQNTSYSKVNEIID